jgi:hypothetical protein
VAAIERRHLMFGDRLVEADDETDTLRHRIFHQRPVTPTTQRGRSPIEGTTTPNPTLLLPRSLVLAAVLVVVTGARVALAPSYGDADRRPCSRYHNVDTDRSRERGYCHVIRSHSQRPGTTCNLSRAGPYSRVQVRGRLWSSGAVDVATDVGQGIFVGGLQSAVYPVAQHLVPSQVFHDQASQRSSAITDDLARCGSWHPVGLAQPDHAAAQGRPSTEPPVPWTVAPMSTNWALPDQYAAIGAELAQLTGGQAVGGPRRGRDAGIPRAGAVSTSTSGTASPGGHPGSAAVELDAPPRSAGPRGALLADLRLVDPTAFRADAAGVGDRQPGARHRPARAHRHRDHPVGDRADPAAARIRRGCCRRPTALLLMPNPASLPPTPRSG